MRELFLKLIRYRGEYVALGRNQAMKMLLNNKDVVNTWGTPLSPVINGQFSRGISRGTEASRCTVLNPLDRLDRPVTR